MSTIPTLMLRSTFAAAEDAAELDELTAELDELAAELEALLGAVVALGAAVGGAAVGTGAGAGAHAARTSATNKTKTRASSANRETRTSAGAKADLFPFMASSSFRKSKSFLVTLRGVAQINSQRRLITGGHHLLGMNIMDGL